MKTMVLLLVSAATVASAQQRPSRVVYPQLQEVYRPRAEDFRIVNGQTYNTVLSTNWQAMDGEIAAVFTNRTARLKTFTIQGKYQVATGTTEGQDAYGGVILLPQERKVKVGDEKVWGREIVIKNLDEPALGQAIKVKAIKVGTTNVGGAVLEVWDAGVLPAKVKADIGNKAATPATK